MDTFEPLSLQVPKDVLPETLAAVGSENQPTVKVVRSDLLKAVLDEYKDRLSGEGGFHIYHAIKAVLDGAA